MEFLVFGGVVVAGFVLMAGQQAYERHVFNGGVHRKCGGFWRFQYTYRPMGDDPMYKYRCDRCGEELTCVTNHGTD